MNSMDELFAAVKNDDLKEFYEVMEYCDKRVTADEGIPAVIGLDDLTASWNTTYTGAKGDEHFHLLMAAAAMVFAGLYEQKDPQSLGEYPGIAPAMSAMAEMFFHSGDDKAPIPYRKVIRDFLK